MKNLRTVTNNRRSERSGFTLIEMLVVLAILVLLMSMVGPRILGSRKKADISTAKTQIGMLEASLERYVLDTRTYPSTEDGLVALIEEPSDEDNGKNWDGPYITKSKIPKDPWGGDYQYEFPPSHGKDKDTPEIWSTGPDGEEGTEDDIVSWVDEDEDAVESDES